MNLNFCIFFLFIQKKIISHSEFFKDFLARTLKELKFECTTVTNYKKKKVLKDLKAYPRVSKQIKIHKIA